MGRRRDAMFVELTGVDPARRLPQKADPMTSSSDVAYLRSGSGAQALAAAESLDATGMSLLRDLALLRRTLAPRQAAAVLGQTALRRRAATKFSLASRMLFTAEALEQASGELVTNHTAARYRGTSRVADCCCGLGGDTLALARECRVDAYDIDPARLACAEHNAEVYGVGDRVTFRLADVRELDPTGLDAIFFDPGRRAGGRRIFALDAYQPPVSLVDRWLPAVPAIGVKIAPGVEHGDVRWTCEQEFIAQRSDLKACVLWFGPLASAARRASILPEQVSLIPCLETAAPDACDPSGWLFDPSPAVTRAGLVWELAALVGAQQLDPELAYLCGPDKVETPFAQAYRIEEWMPFNLKKVKARLRALDVGRVLVRRRGSPVDPESLERRLRQAGRQQRVLFLTRLNGRPIVIICADSVRTTILS